MNLNQKENEKKLYSLLMENLSRVGILDARALNEAQKKLEDDQSS